MPDKFSLENIDLTAERSLLIGMIMSKEFIDEILPFFDYAYLQNSFSKKICKWILDFYRTYKQAPQSHIQDMFDMAQDELTEAESDILRAFLSDLSRQYGKEARINYDYLRDETLKLFHKQEVVKASKEATALAEKGRLDEASQRLSKLRKIERVISGWYNPFTQRRVFEAFEYEGGDFFNFPGDLGRLTGEFKRGWFVGILGAFKRGKCLSEDCKVLLCNGEYKTVREIVESKKDQVVTFDQRSMKFVTSTITDFYNNGEKDVYRITTRTGREVDITSNHPLLTTYGWEELDSLKEGDRIAVPRSIPFFGNNVECPNKIKLLSMLLADGGLTGTYISFTKNNREIREEFKEIIKWMGDDIVEHDKEIYISKKDNKKNPRIISKTRKWLDDIEVGRVKSKDKVIPDFVFSLTQGQISLFLSYLFTCDGWISQDSNSVQVGYSSASKEMVYQVNHLLLRFGIIAKIRPFEGKCNGKNFPHWELIIGNKGNILKFMDKVNFRFEKRGKSNKLRKIVEGAPDGRDLIDLFYDHQLINALSSGYKLPKELRETLRQAKIKNGGISRYKLWKFAEFTKDPTIERIAKSDILWDQIVNIEWIGKKQTYDLTVKEHHNFVSNDILVHNTWWLQELAMAAMLRRLRVAFVSLEMHEEAIDLRLYKRLTALESRRREAPSQVVYPTFDCVLNQTGECLHPLRTNTIALIGEDGKVPDFDPRMEYKPCTNCRYDGSDRFMPTYWFEVRERGRFAYDNVWSRLSRVLKEYGDENFRAKSYPRFSANVQDILKDLDQLERHDHFIPDVVVVDYADILRPETKYESKREQINETWMTLARLAGERSCLVATASQSNRPSLHKANLGQEDTAEEIRKIAHVDMMAALNQTPREKRHGVMRFAMLAHRHMEFDEDMQVMVLQNLKVGQPALDYQLYRRREG